MARPRERDKTAAATTGFAFAKPDGGDRTSTVEQAVFAATEELLQTVAVADLTVAQILKAAGISRTTFYHYFSSKYAIVSAMLQALQDELVDVMQPWFTRGERSPEAALGDALLAVAQVWERHRPILRASTENWHHEPQIGEPWVAMMDRFTDDIAHQIDRERRSGHAPDGVDSAALARGLVWGSERMLYLYGFGVYGEARELAAVDALVSTWLGTVYQGR